MLPEITICGLHGIAAVQGGVAHQIGDDLPQVGAIAPEDRQRRLDDHFDLSSRQQVALLEEHLVDHPLSRHDARPRRRNARTSQIRQLSQVPAKLFDTGRHMADLIGKTDIDRRRRFRHNAVGQPLKARVQQHEGRRGVVRQGAQRITRRLPLVVDSPHCRHDATPECFPNTTSRLVTMPACVRMTLVQMSARADCSDWSDSRVRRRV